MGRTRRVLGNPAAHKKFQSNFYWQWPGEQVGNGLSANEAVDAAHVSIKLITTNRRICLIGLSWGGSSTEFQYSETIGQASRETTECSKIERLQECDSSVREPELTFVDIPTKLAVHEATLYEKARSG